jgi:hypothetical protein
MSKILSITSIQYVLYIIPLSHHKFHSREFLTNTTDFGRTEKLDLLSESVTETGFFKQGEPID